MAGPNRVIPPMKVDPDGTFDSRYWDRNTPLPEGPQGPEGPEGPQGPKPVIVSTEEPDGGDYGDLWYNPEGIPEIGDPVGLTKTEADGYYAGIDDLEAVEVAVTQASINADVLAALRFDPEHPSYGAQRGDESEPGSIVKAANRAAIQLAANDARDTGGTLVLKGTYWIDDTIQIECHVDGASGALRINDTAINPAVLVGRSGSNLNAQHIVLPEIRQMGRAAGGWGGGDVGVRVNRLNQSNLWITHVQDFSVNVEMYAQGGGTCYNNIHLGILHNGKIGLDFQSGAGGWVNENVFIGGRFVIDTGEGENISGCRHIRVGASASGHLFNNNLFIKPSIEGNAPEYHVEGDGVHNTILQGRWEASPPKVLWGPDANGWVIDDGYQSHGIVYTGNASNTRASTRNHLKWRAGGTASGVMRLSNATSDAHPALTILPSSSTFWSMDAGASYTVAIGSRYTNWKATSDPFPRIQVDSLNGRLYFGYGNSAPVARLNSYGSSGDLYTPGRMYMAGGLGVGNSETATTLGSVTRKMEVFDAAGTSLGFVPIYDAITA